MRIGDKNFNCIKSNMMTDLCSLHLEIKSESNLITEEQRNSFKSWAHGLCWSFPSLSVMEGSGTGSVSRERGQGFIGRIYNRA